MNFLVRRVTGAEASAWKKRMSWIHDSTQSSNPSHDSFFHLNQAEIKDGSSPY